PKEVGAWVKRARKGIPHVSTATFPSTWRAWWAAINPGWRRSEGELAHKANRDFKVLECLGINGFLNVIACLKWWHMALSMEESAAEWQDAVGDVRWVLEQMIES
ncbi:hypothetical protein C8R45DRAFT_762444, partial [Mycena sanguinolenta]